MPDMILRTEDEMAHKIRSFPSRNFYSGGEANKQNCQFVKSFKGRRYEVTGRSLLTHSGQGSCPEKVTYELRPER